MTAIPFCRDCTWWVLICFRTVLSSCFQMPSGILIWSALSSSSGSGFCLGFDCFALVCLEPKLFPSFCLFSICACNSSARTSWMGGWHWLDRAFRSFHGFGDLRMDAIVTCPRTVIRWRAAAWLRCCWTPCSSRSLRSSAWVAWSKVPPSSSWETFSACRWKFIKCCAKRILHSIASLGGMGTVWSPLKWCKMNARVWNPQFAANEVGTTWARTCPMQEGYSSDSKASWIKLWIWLCISGETVTWTLLHQSQAGLETNVCQSSMQWRSWCARSGWQVHMPEQSSGLRFVNHLVCGQKRAVRSYRHCTLGEWNWDKRLFHQRLSNQVDSTALHYVEGQQHLVVWIENLYKGICCVCVISDWSN